MLVEFRMLDEVAPAIAECWACLPCRAELSLLLEARIDRDHDDEEPPSKHDSELRHCSIKTKLTASLTVMTANSPAGSNRVADTPRTAMRSCLPWLLQHQMQYCHGPPASAS